jgi:Protein of unknown function (DUF2490)
MEHIMSQTRKICGKAILFACFACLPIYAQDTQFLPEVDGYLKVNSYLRADLQAKDDREGGDPTQFTFGPSIQVYLKPLIKLKRVTVFDLDDAKSRPLVFESGYRLITAPNTPNENRAIEAVTFHLPLTGRLLLADRNRADLDWKNGTFTWRYRNRLTLQRTVSIHSYHLIPYIAAEPFYESQYRKWSATDLYAGSVFPLGKHIELNPYYEYENDTSKKPNRQTNFVGLAAYFYFSMKNSSPSSASAQGRDYGSAGIVPSAGRGP